MRRNTLAARTAAVITVAAVGVLGVDYATYAATGDSLILGRTNTAGTYTTISRTTPGKVLNLRTTSSTDAPLSVNGRGRVANLNSDYLDGLTSTDLQKRVSGTCASGTAARSVGSTGSLGCVAVGAPNTAHSWRLPVGESGPDTEYDFFILLESSPQPAGTYQVTGVCPVDNGTTANRGTATALLYAFPPAGGAAPALSGNTSRFTGGLAIVSATGVVTTTEAKTFALLCDTDAATYTLAAETQLSVVPLDGGTTQTGSTGSADPGTTLHGTTLRVAKR